MAIRNGVLKYDELIAWASEMDAKLDDLYERSPLPRSPDREAINNLVMDIKLNYWRENGLIRS